MFHTIFWPLKTLTHSAANTLTFLTATLYCIAAANIPLWLVAQPLPFERYQNVHVGQQTDDDFLGAWQGGLNAPQFGQIDLDHDGQPDLVVFERAGNKILPYLYVANAAECGSTLQAAHYCFAPEYEALFPPLHDWAQWVNWDNTDPADIVTYGTAGISLYLGNYNDVGQLQFLLAADALRYQGLNGPLNIPANPAERPAFADINQDGDLDVLNFDFSGAFVEYFENQSQELTASAADTVWFLRQTKCWGHFKEDPNSPQILLNEFCTELLPSNNDSAFWQKPIPTNENLHVSPHTVANKNKAQFMPQLHSGSALLMWDIDNDQDQDLLVGDVSGRNITFLRNGGTPETAHINTADPTFPSYNIPLYFYRFPAPMQADIDNDNRPDLLVAPNNIELQSKDQIWYYRNISTDDSAAFALQTTRFLEGEMIDVGMNSYPAWADYDNDGLLDLFVGNWGYLDTSTLEKRANLALFRNIGTATAPAFWLVSTDFALLSQYNLRGIYPAFADMDSDGDADLVAGDDDGFLHYFRNTAPAGQPMQLTAWQLAFAEGAGTGTATPCLWPLTGNPNSYDIVVGEKAGKLNLLQNISTSPDTLKVQLINSFWGQVDVRTIGNPFGYSAPALARLNPDDPERLYLIVNSESGRLFAYTDLEQPIFTPINNLTEHIAEGGLGGLAITDLNADNGLDMVVGSRRGGLGLFAQTPIQSTHISPNNNPTTPPALPLQAHWATTTNNAQSPNTLYLQLPETHLTGQKQAIWTIALINMWGQKIAQTSLQFLGNTPSQIYEWSLPNNLPVGLFFVQAANQYGQMACTKLPLMR